MVSLSALKSTHRDKKRRSSSYESVSKLSLTDRVRSVNSLFSLSIAYPLEYLAISRPVLIENRFLFAGIVNDVVYT